MSDDFHRLERAYRTTVHANRALLNATSEAQLAPEFCRIAVEQGGYRLAWVGYAENDEAKSIRPIAEIGFDAGYLEKARLTWADSERGRGPTGTAVRTGRPQVAHNIDTDPRFAPWRADARRHGFGSSASLPLRDGGTTFGAFNLYAAESDAFDAAEMELLELLAADLAHAILYARGRRTLCRLQQALERGGQLVAAGQAAAKLAHDINNCLSVVLPCLDELATRAPPDCQPAVTDATLAIERASALTGQLLRPGEEQSERSSLTSPDDALVEMAPTLRRALGEDVTLDLLLEASGKHTRIERLELIRSATMPVMIIWNPVNSSTAARINDWMCKSRVAGSKKKKYKNRRPSRKPRPSTPSPRIVKILIARYEE